ncbi:hypothetical protein [Micromonospora rubida]|uniref:hypothetical protein n=1 Tax=Micromonospora rubida TaxID=2697657 RepID=UPI001377E819|nr:hypothetical protein [Micromonospora rubida]NBE81452.1 hypothetical protein [Micromonospora rubida]
MGQHPPRYAGGPCFVCSKPWPCFERQLASLVEFAGQGDLLVAYMGDWYRLGVEERERRGLSPDPDMELRHLGWLDMVLPAQGEQRSGDA